MSDPIVSVLMPVYNGQKYLNEAIDSVLAQTFKDFELIVVDDGSTDETEKLLLAYKDSRVRVFKNERNSGVAITLNRGISECRGTYIARMDSDDISFPNRLEKQVGFLEKHKSISLVGGSIQCFGESNSNVKYWKNHSEIHAHCLFNTPFAHPVVCWRKKDFEKHDLVYQETPPTAEDFELWERACRHVQTANLRTQLIWYRIDPQIKISSYLEQQHRGAKVVRERLLGIAGIRLTEEETSILHQMGEGSLPVTVDALRSAEGIYRKILLSNRESGYFKECGLKKVVSKHWYRLFQRFLGNIPKQALQESIDHAEKYQFDWKCRFAAKTKMVRC